MLREADISNYIRLNINKPFHHYSNIITFVLKLNMAPITIKFHMGGAKHVNLDLVFPESIRSCLTTCFRIIIILSVVI